MTCVSSVGIIKSKKTMMKKEYVKPEFLVEDILLETMIATSGNIGDNDTEIEDGEHQGGFGANDRRGAWGDFWN